MYDHALRGKGLGIEAPEGYEGEEAATLGAAVQRAADAAETWLSAGIEAAMNAFN